MSIKSISIATMTAVIMLLLADNSKATPVEEYLEAFTVIYGKPGKITIADVINKFDKGKLNCYVPFRPYNALILESFESQDKKALIAACLKQEGANLNITNAAGRTVLHIAARQDDQEVLKMILDHHPNLNAKMNNGNTPLMEAVEGLKVDNVRILKEAGAETSSALEHAKDYQSHNVFTKPEDQQKLQQIIDILSTGATKK